jgi:uncharacterized delta-60 repeat protein
MHPLLQFPCTCVFAQLFIYQNHIMKKFTSTLTMFLLCLYVSAQVGSLDATFNASGTPGFNIANTGSGSGISDQIQGIAVQSDGKIIVAGYGQDQNFTVARYTTAGALDATFGTGGIVQYRAVSLNAAQAYGVAIQSDGKIVVVGWSWETNRDFCVMRLNNTDGSLDGTFGTSGVTYTSIGSGHAEAYGVAIQSDGKIILTGISSNGTDNDFTVVRYTSTGSLDATFGTGGIVTTNVNGNDVPESVVINKSNGTIIVAGTSNASASGDFTVVRYTSAGVADGTFGTSGIVTTDIGSGTNDAAHSVALQSDGNIVVAGSTPNGANKDVAVVRYTTTGALDGTFGTSGKVITNYGAVNTDDDARSVVLQTDGKIVVGGSTDGAGTTFAFMLLRYSSAGTLDASFGTGGKAAADLAPAAADIGMAMTMNTGRIYLGGYSGSPKDFALAAFQTDGVLPLVLTQFYAQKQTSKVLLQWSTSSEENLKQFLIERSSDGKTYNAIGEVTAAGNSTTTRNYFFADGSPFMSANNYYRLVMQDIDGTYKYSKVLIVKFTGQLTTNIQAFPNPAKDILQVQLPGGLVGKIGLQIIDFGGRVVKTNTLASDGNALTTSFDVSSLQSGIYILKAQAGSTVIVTRFAKH